MKYRLHYSDCICYGVIGYKNNQELYEQKVKIVRACLILLLVH